MFEKETNFESKALSAIEYIADAIEEKDQDCLFEVDFLSEILKLTTPKGEYVINKHSAAKQIWVASPISGPYHFSLKNNHWINKDNIDLFQLLSREFNEFFNIELKYE
jgi:iron donor protein CyaY